MVASISYEGTIDRHRKRIAELESDIERYSKQIRRLKSSTSVAAAAAAAAAISSVTAAPSKTGTTTSPSLAKPVIGVSEDDRAGKTRYWTEMEHNQFLYAGRLFGAKNYVAISQYVGTRTPKQVRTHAQKYQMKLEREARKRRAHAAAIAAAGSNDQTAAIMAAAVAASSYNNPYLAAAAAAHHHPSMYLSPMPLHPTPPPAAPIVPSTASAGQSCSSLPTTSSEEFSFIGDDGLNPPTSNNNTSTEDDSSGLQYLRDSACSPVSIDSALDSVHCSTGPKRNASVGNLADYDEFMRKVTKNTFADADLDNMLTSPVKSETFEVLEDL